MERRRVWLALAAIVAGIAIPGSRIIATASQSGDTIERGDFRFTYDARGVSNLSNPHDPFGATVTAAARGRGARGSGTPGEGAALGLTIQYRTASDGTWQAWQRGPSPEASPASGTVVYASARSDDPLTVKETYRTDGRVLDWTIDLGARRRAVHVGDLAISIPIAPPAGATPQQIFERGFLAHQFISGAGSFVYYVRASGAPPFLLLTVRPGTKLEYFTTGAGAGLFVHASKTGGAQLRGTWRQPLTALDLAPGQSRTYGFRFQWAHSYDDLRRLLYDDGLFDVRVVPGMTVPVDLTARFSIRTRAHIDRIDAEFPSDTTITPLNEPAADTHVYEAAFKKLGENELAIHHDNGRVTYLEFFVTEPMETLIRKRAAFLVDKQQVKNPAKWWDGVYGPYDMKAQVTRTIDDPDIFVDRMVYALTCDDPGLSKAPYLAEKNVTYPDQREIQSIEYYLKHFVWGGLQRRDDERPYPFGVYGTPNWFVNRDPARRKAYAESLKNGATALADLDKAHVWRSYDYPHVIMLYYEMYRVAKLYPEMSTYLDAAGYLNRAWETARAFFTYPYEIYPSYYETYKWGLYNELVVLPLIDALEHEGFPSQAAWLRAEWEKKVKYFVYDDPYPFRSEYAFDRTAFESTYAFAKYGATHDMQPDEHLWYDVKLRTWYSHPLVRRQDSRAFMDRQLASGLAVRGWLNPAYYTLGSDAGMSYMAAMGGEGILDYGLNFAPDPFDWLQLGYASYLSSWALMNTGTPQSNYGYWFPGQANDGAAGWQFMSSQAGSAWMGSSVPGGVTVPRGPWNYDGEIDLGFAGALRMAATVVTRDPTFGWIAYGGATSENARTLSVNPRDGLRQRLDIIVPDRGLPFPSDLTRLKIALDRDNFAKTAQIVIDKSLDRVAFTLENGTGDTHTTLIRLSLPPEAHFELRQDGKAVPLEQTGDWDYPWKATLSIDPSPASLVLTREHS
ncbi:MAG: DUF5695 domain-containing protein [Vicinamibacterales bacterium]